ncbi:P-loop containing nucleoside triphosphate hydrolase protein [Hyaloraphidium curvatum]|nr:P-loop containing nucleoside triphosphate hydrolase protein [Hyaloraphidium curvatum]
MSPIGEFCDLQLRLLLDERNAEIEEIEAVLARYPPRELQRRFGLALLGLKLTSIRTGLGGKTVVELGGDADALPAHRFRVGDVVGLDNKSGEDKERSTKGTDKTAKPQTRFDTTAVVARVTDKAITLALDGEHDDSLFDKPVRMFKLANNISFERMEKAIKDLKARDVAEGGIRSDIIRVLFGLDKPAVEAVKVDSIRFFTENLNESQKRAVALALGAQTLALIHGPPGTGKTHTVVEVIRQLATPKERGGRGERVLVCGPSNISVDNLVERLAPTRLPIVRVGNVVRVLPTIVQHALDVRIRSSDEGQIVCDVRADIDKTLRTATSSKSRLERREAYRSLKDLRKELRVREDKVVSGIVRNASVVLCTLNGSASKTLKDMEWDTLVIDEAAQALEAECWIAILKARKRVILAGDHLQLPPTVKSVISSGKPRPAKPSKASDHLCKAIEKGGGLTYTLFDRLIGMYGDSVKVMLEVQYRMHAKIQQFSSEQLYGGKLVPHTSVKTHLLCDLPNVARTDDTTEPVVFHDTAGSEMRESSAGDAQDGGPKAEFEANSKFNENEVEIVVEHVKRLIEANVHPSDIGITTPYNGQVNRLRAALAEQFPDLEIASIDSYQGREKHAMILSLVRSNEEGDVGFLSESRRLNVAITRSRRHLFVVGDSETLSRNPFLKSLCSFLETEGELRM